MAAPKVIAFKVVVNGVDTAIRNEQELAAAVKLVSKAYKAADYGTEEREQAAQQLGKLKKLQADSRQEIRDTAREYQIAEDRGKGSYRALNAELVNLRRTYKELSRAEREVAGPDLLKRIDVLDRELKELDADMGQYQRNVGNYASAFEGVGGALLDLGGLGDLAGLATPAGAVTAIGTAAIATGKYVLDATENVQRLQGSIQALTGQTGEELDRFTVKVAAIAETFKKTEDEVLLSANALSKQLSIPFDEAVDRIGVALANGVDVNGQLLDSAEEYAAQVGGAFNSAEEDANAFFQILEIGNREGVTSDKLIDTFKEARIRLRELTPATREALDALGIGSVETAELIQKKGIGPAIAAVAEELKKVEKDGPVAGQVLADVFGGPGEDAGFNAVTSLSQVNGALRQVIDTENERAVQLARTNEVNEEFAAVQVQLANAVGQGGATVENLTTQGQTLLLKFLIPFISIGSRLYNVLEPIGGLFLSLAKRLGIVSEEAGILDLVFVPLTATVNAVATVVETVTARVESFVGGVQSAYATVKEVYQEARDFFLGAQEARAGFGGAGAEGEFERAARGVDGLTDAQREGRKAQEEYTAAQQKAAEEAKRQANTLAGLKERLKELNEQREKTQLGSAEFADLTKQINATQKELDRYTKATKASAVATDKFAKDSIGFLQAELADLQAELQNATTPDRERGLLEQIIDVEGAIAKIEEGRTAIRNEIARLGDNLEPVSLIAPPARQLDQLDSLNADILAANEEREKTNTDLTLEERRDLNRRLRENERAAAAQRKQDAIDEANERAAIFAQAQETIFGSFFSINSALAEASRSRSEEAIKGIQRQYAAEIEAAEGNAARQEQLREEQAEAEARIQAEQLERAKKYQTAAALATAAAGVISILAAPTTIPDPFGAIFKGVQIAALAATTAIQIANIQRQTVAARGLLVEDDDPAMTQPRRRARTRQDRRTHRRRELAARGSIIRGWVRGQTHAGPGGGVPLTIHGQRVLVEAGEKIDHDEHGATVIVNKRSAEVNREVLDAIDGKTFEGKRTLLHQINTQRGYGRPLISPTFARGGLVSGIPVPADTAPAVAGLQLYNEATVGGRDRREPASTEPVTAHLTDTDVARIANAVRRGTAEGAATGAYQGSVDGADAAARARAAADRRNARSGLKPTDR